ncbi:MAG: hypothetical protein K6E59_03730 [Bacilli bacterium]|nr:hypothetical protein [Bacilli bacterium]
MEETTKPVIPLCVVIDASASMLTCVGGTPTGRILERDGQRFQEMEGEVTTVLDRANQALMEALEEIKRSVLPTMEVEICVALAKQSPSLHQRFVPLSELDSLPLPDNAIGDEGNLIGGISVAADAWRIRKGTYCDQGIPHGDPCFLLVTDGILRNDETPSDALLTLKEERKRDLLVLDIGFDERSLHILQGRLGQTPVQPHDLASILLQTPVSRAPEVPGDLGSAEWGEW